MRGHLDTHTPQLDARIPADRGRLARGFCRLKLLVPSLSIVVDRVEAAVGHRFRRHFSQSCASFKGNLGVFREF